MRIRSGEWCLIVSMIFFVKRLCSKVMVSFTYCDVHRCCCSDLLLDSWMIQLFTLQEKANDE